MKQKRVILVIIAIAMCFLISFVWAFFLVKEKSAQPERYGKEAFDEMYSGEFWAKRAGNREMLSKAEIESLNKVMKSGGDGFVDLYDFENTMTREELLEKIEMFKIPNGRFFTGRDGKKLADEAFYKKIADNRNLGGILNGNPVLKAVTVDETEVRDFPSEEPLFASGTQMDLFCENRMYVFEKCVVLHTSSDKKWYFIQGDSFMGWIKAESAAFCDEKDWVFLDESEKLVVVGSYAITDEDPYDDGLSQRKLSMGTRLPLCGNKISRINEVSTISSSVAYMPFRNKDGWLFKKAVRIPKNGNVREGYLPFTSRNVVLQSFKLLGERYGWGGSNGARDCSAYVRDVYRCFGIELPKNSAMQGNLKVKGRVDLSAFGDDEKEKKIKKLSPGAVLEMKGHVMLYIGKYKGKAFVIHDVYAFGEPPANERKVINCVTVSDLYVTRKDGTSFLSNIRSAVCFDKT